MHELEWLFIFIFILVVCYETCIVHSCYSVDFYLVLQGRKEDSGAILAEALRVIVVAIDGGVATYLGMESHPSLQILQQIWPALDSIGAHWPTDANVTSALCELWGMIARKVGLVLAGVLPAVISAATVFFKRHQSSTCLDCISDVRLLLWFLSVVPLSNFMRSFHLLFYLLYTWLGLGFLEL